MPESLSGPPPPFFIRLFAQVATGLHYLESVGAVIILWLCPSLTPEPRIHQFISTSPIHHKHHHHHHPRCVSRRLNAILPQSGHTVLSEQSSPTLQDLERIDEALKQEQQREDEMVQSVRWRAGQRSMIEEDYILNSKEERPLPTVVSTTELPCF